MALFNNVIEYDCTTKCKLIYHAQEIRRAISWKEVNETTIAAFIMKTCQNYLNVVDELGRVAIHWSVSYGRYELTEWLINQGADINCRDKDDYLTPLHRALFYGHINLAVLLIERGAHLSTYNIDVLQPFDVTLNTIVCDIDANCFNVENFNISLFKQYCQQYSEEQQLKEIMYLPDINSPVPYSLIEMQRDLNAPVRDGLKLSRRRYDLKIPLQTDFQEILIWGNNNNSNIGMEPRTDSKAPHQFDFFKKNSIRIANKNSSIALGLYHSLFVDTKGDVYVVGNGQDGKLGIEGISFASTPMKVNILKSRASEKIVAVSASRHHSLVLSNTGHVYACGINQYGQIVSNTHPKGSVVPTFIKQKKLNGNNCGIIAHDFYSLAYSNHELYVWGYNGGQFGVHWSVQTDCEEISLPITIAELSHVEASNSAIICAGRGYRGETESSDDSYGSAEYSDEKIVIYYGYQIKYIRSPCGTSESIKFLKVSNGYVYKKPNNHDETRQGPLRIGLVTTFNNMYIWLDEFKEFIPIDFNLGPLFISSFTWIRKSSQILVSCNGQIYVGTLDSKIRNIEPGPAQCTQMIDYQVYGKSESKKIRYLSKNKGIMHFKRISHTHRVINVWCDLDGTSYLAAQEDIFPDLNKYTPKQNASNFMYTKTQSECDESNYDIEFYINGERFLANKVIVFTRALGLHKMYRQLNYKTNSMVLDDEGMTSTLFQVFLEYIYSGNPNDLISKIEKAPTMVHNTFTKYLGSTITGPHFKGLRLVPSISYASFPELTDLTLICDQNIRINVHKCILTSQCEYFAIMLRVNSWSESREVKLLTFEYDYIIGLVEYLYTNNLQKIEKRHDGFLYNFLAIADHFLVPNLKVFLQRELFKRVSFNKFADMFQFAITYNCDRLETDLVLYLINNTNRLLECRILQNLGYETLKRLSDNYLYLNRPFMEMRVLDLNEATKKDLYFCEGVCITFAPIRQSQKDDLSREKKTKSLNISKAEMAKRNCETDGIDELRKMQISCSEPTKNEQNSSPIIEKETLEVTEKFQKEAELWTRIQNKKQNMKKPAAIIVNSIMQEENKMSDDFVTLTLTDKFLRQFPKTNSFSTVVYDDKNLRNEISFGDFTPRSAKKMSQKQRKRLSSEENVQEKCIAQEKLAIVKSPWNIVPAPEINSSGITTSINYVSIKQITPNANKFPQNSMEISSTFQNRPLSRHSGLRQIQANERKQRNQYNKMTSKSLNLLQIEETAVNEIREFYNCDYVFDESIDVQLQRPTLDSNFATWNLDDIDNK